MKNFTKKKINDMILGKSKREGGIIRDRSKKRYEKVRKCCSRRRYQL